MAKMSLSAIQLIKKIAVNGFIAIALIGSASIEGKSKSIDSVIDKTATFLVRDWADNKDFNEWRPPQVMAIPSSTKIYGACGKWREGDHVADTGSYYCPTTHTIILDIDQVRTFYTEFGPASVSYIIAHEFGHAIQNRYNSYPEGSASELQADCLAGILIKTGSSELGITRKDTLNMSLAAYGIGSASHGSGAQRSYALMAGMGIVNYGCTTEEMHRLSKDEINDPIFKKLMNTRSGSGGVDLSMTPYPKTIQDLGEYLN